MQLDSPQRQTLLPFLPLSPVRGNHAHRLPVMAQGTGKLPARNLARSKKHQSPKHKTKLIAKGRLQRKPKHIHDNVRMEEEATKTINKRNERTIAAKAVSVGTKFFLSDIREIGSNQVKKLTAERDKKQQKSKSTSRLEQQIDKLRK